MELLLFTVVLALLGGLAAAFGTDSRPVDGAREDWPATADRRSRDQP